MNTRTLTVTGRGRVETPPNQVTLSFSLSAEGYAYQGTVEALNAKAAELKEALAAFLAGGVRLKTGSFSILPKYQYHDRTRQREFRGFTASHDLQLDMPFDKETLSRALNAVAASGSDASFNIRFSVAESKEIKRRTLQAAVADAKAQAETIATAAGVCLGGIVAIDDGRTEVYLVEPDFDLSPMACPDANPPEADIEPADVRAAVAVTIVWEILAMPA